MKIVAVIPARMNSTRFPGKPLLEIQGLPMIEHVRRRTLLCDGFSEVAVATCDKEIFDAVKKYGGKVIMTSPDHIMASDRVAEAVEKLECSHVVNVQGDEVLVVPEDLSKMVESIKNNPAGMYWNAIARIELEEELVDSSIVKCVVSTTGRIMYCSRNFSYLKLSEDFEPVRKILGILGYSRKGLEAYKELARSPVEVAAAIDQSRVIEHDLLLIGIPFSTGYPGINEPRELPIVNDILEKDKLQSVILEKILNWKI